MSITEHEGAGGPAGLVPGESAASIAAGKSLLDRVKERRAQQAEDDALTLDIPSWGGDLKARYKVIPRSELEEVLKRAQKKSADNVLADADFLIKACIGIVAVDPETGEEEEVASGYNMPFAQTLGAEASTARELVVYLCKGNGIALGAHAQRVALWMQDPSKFDGDPS